jgi:hypothetical protein
MKTLLRAGGALMLLVCVGSIGLSGLLSALNPMKPGDEPALVGVLWLSSFVGFPIVGAVIVWKLPRNTLGWMLSGIGASIGVLALSGEYATYALVTRSGELAGGQTAAWVSTWIGNTTVTLILLLLIFFPRGAPRNRPWRFIAGGVVAASAVLGVMYAIRPGRLDAAPELGNPLGIEGIRWFLDPAIATLANLLVLVLLAAVVDKVVMFRRARGDERQQIKWFALAALGFPVLFAVSLVFELFFGRNRWGDVDPVVIAFLLGFNGMAAGIGVAVFKYRLYDVGTIVNRTLVYGAMTAILASAYVGLVFGFQSLLAPFTAESDLAIAASTLAVAALFRPVRTRIQSFIDHRFYRRKFDTEKTIEAFNAHLRDEVDLGQLSSRLLTVVSHTMQPAHVSLWLRSEA